MENEVRLIDGAKFERILGNLERHAVELEQPQMAELLRYTTKWLRMQPAVDAGVVNPYWKNICAIAEKQRAKGIATYGQGIEINHADAVTRIEYLQEELVDALMYCEWIKDGIKDAVPVVHGRWIEKQEPIPWCEDDVDVFTVCSVCDCYSPGESNYCPNCGAKMDLED